MLVVHRVGSLAALRSQRAVTITSPRLPNSETEIPATTLMSEVAR